MQKVGFGALSLEILVLGPVSQICNSEISSLNTVSLTWNSLNFGRF